MRGHVQKKNGRWYVVLELDREDGKRRQKWISPQKELGLAKPANKKQAEELLIKLINETREGTYIEPSKMLLSQFLEKWLNDHARVNVKQKTLESYQNAIYNHINPALGKIKLHKLRPAHIQQLLSEKLSEGKLSNRSIQYLHTVLKNALNHAVKWELVNRNAAMGVSPPRPEKKKVQAWSREEAKTFLDALKVHRLYPLYLLALTTGMRKGELLGLRWQDVDLKHNRITILQTLSSTNDGLVLQESVKTTSSSRTVDISEAAAAVLRQHRKRQLEEYMVIGRPEQDLVFTSERGTPINPHNLTRHFNRTIEQLGLRRIRFHDLRHTHATMLLEDGVHPKIVSERLGHSQISITMDTYSHVLPRIQKEAALKTDDLIL